MRDLVLIVGFFRGSMFAGLAFLTVAVLAAVLLMVFVLDSTGAGPELSILVAIASAFPLGSIFGYSLLYTKSRYSSLRILFIGVLVPALASTAVVLDVLGIVSSVNLSSTGIQSPEAFAWLSLVYDQLRSFVAIFLFAQIFTGWLTYPCGIAAAYFLSRLRKSSVLSDPTILGIGHVPKEPQKTMCSSLEKEEEK